ncbi:MAG: PQQ-like beta-propeller repeat protein [Acidobacteria bacterium]|nr:PQQ-like beta-propeller repeat protein [Acidobacteriota bacterium]
MLKHALAPALVLAGTAFAQMGNDWTTAGFDAQRSHWVRADLKISPENMSKPGFELAWKLKLDEPSGAAAITPPSLLDFYIGYRGFRALGFFATPSGRMVGVDTELGRQEWEVAAPAPAGCSGSLAAVARPTSTSDYPVASAPRGSGRGTPARSGVGGPFEGAVTLAARMSRPTVPVAAPKPRPRPNAAADANPFAPRVQYAVALGGDGRLHMMWVSNGNETGEAIPFLPPGVGAHGLTVFDGTAYVSGATCGEPADSGVWALDLATKKVSHWKTTSAGVAGSDGPAFGPDGKAYVAAGSELVALAPKTLETVAVYKHNAARFSSTPVIFRYKNRNLLAVTSDDGRLNLLDTAGLKSVGASAAFSGAKFPAGALASWEDSAGDRWILAPASAGPGADTFRTNGAVQGAAIAAFKVIDRNGAPALDPVWMSRDMAAPATPIVVNGVVFALDGGTPAHNAVLYALDAATGREVWSSGSQMTSYSKGGLSSGGARVYVATQDGVQYAFGFPIEH